MGGLGKIGLNLQSLLFYLVNFGVIAFVLARFVWKPVVGFLEERQRTIENNLKESETLKRDFAETVEKQQAKKQEAISEMQADLSQIRKTAEEDAKALIREGQQERDRIIAQAKIQVDALKRDLLETAEEEFFHQVKEVIESALKNNVTADQAAETIRKFWARQKQSSKT